MYDIRRPCESVERCSGAVTSQVEGWRAVVGVHCNVSPAAPSESCTRRRVCLYPTFAPVDIAVA